MLLGIVILGIVGAHCVDRCYSHIVGSRPKHHRIPKTHLHHNFRFVDSVDPFWCCAQRKKSKNEIKSNLSLIHSKPFSSTKKQAIIITYNRKMDEIKAQLTDIRWHHFYLQFACLHIRWHKRWEIRRNEISDVILDVLVAWCHNWCNRSINAAQHKNKHKNAIKRCIESWRPVFFYGKWTGRTTYKHSIRRNQEHIDPLMCRLSGGNRKHSYKRPIASHLQICTRLHLAEQRNLSLRSPAYTFNRFKEREMREKERKYANSRIFSYQFQMSYQYEKWL